MRISNPLVRRMSRYEGIEEGTPAASYLGVGWKSLYYVMLTMILALVAFIVTMRMISGEVTSPTWLIIFVIVCPIVAFIGAMVAAFAPRTAMVSGSIYCAFMGMTLGFVSALVGAEYGGIVFAAFISTISVFAAMAVLYATGVIRAGHKFKRFLFSALTGIILAQLVIFLVSLIFGGIGGEIWNMFYGTSWLSILISVFMVFLASAFLLVDFDNITMTVEHGMEKVYEWSAAYSLTVTLIWLYVEFLELFLKIASRVKK